MFWNFGPLWFWSSLFLFIFVFGRLRFWLSSFLVIFVFGCLPFLWCRLPFWVRSSSILGEVVFHLGFGTPPQACFWPPYLPEISRPPYYLLRLNIQAYVFLGHFVGTIFWDIYTYIDTDRVAYRSSSPELKKTLPIPLLSVLVKNNIRKFLQQEWTKHK